MTLLVTRHLSYDTGPPWASPFPVVIAAGHLSLNSNLRLAINTVLDLCTRRIVGWALSEKPDAELVIKALDMADLNESRHVGWA